MSKHKVIIMGVAGVGKSEIGGAIALELRKSYSIPAIGITVGMNPDPKGYLGCKDVDSLLSAVLDGPPKPVILIDEYEPPHKFKNDV